MDVATALTLASDSSAVVTGFVLLVSGQPPSICAELLESMPPQCGGARIELVGLTAGKLPGLHDAEGVKWTGEAVTLSGIMREGRLHLAG
jgi:hypothetical protein